MATIPATPRTNLITLASPSAGPFLVGFRLFEDDALKVHVDGAVSTDFTVDATYVSGFDDAATITFGSTLATSTVVQIDGDMTPARDDDYLNGPGLTALMNIEQGRVFAMLSELKMLLDRAVLGLSAVGAGDAADAGGRRIKNLAAPSENADAVRLQDIQNLIAAVGNLPLPTVGQIGYLLQATGTGTYGWISRAVALGAALEAVRGLTPAADRMPYFTGPSGAALATLSAFARTILDDADAATMRATLGAAQEGNVTTASLAASALRIVAEGYASPLDTELASAAWVAGLVAAGWEVRSTYNRVIDVIATTRAETFADGYDYMVLGRGMSRTDTSGLAVTCVFESTNAVTDTEVLTIPLGVAASAYSVVIEIPDPMSFQPLKLIMYSSSVNVAGALSVGAQQVATYGLGGGANNTRTDRLNSISIDLPAAIDAGFLWILRRPRT